MRSYNVNSLSVVPSWIWSKKVKTKNWQIPILILTLTELRLLSNAFTLSVRADRDGGVSPPSQGIADLSIETDRQTSESNVNRAIELLTEAFRVCTSDRCTDQRLSKKWGAIQILNQLLKLCHRIKRYETRRTVTVLRWSLLRISTLSDGRSEDDLRLFSRFVSTHETCVSFTGYLYSLSISGKS